MTEQDTPKMTHDEMIDVLKGLVFGTFDRTTAKEREALDMAISALSADGEYIKKEDALKAVCKFCACGDNGLGLSPCRFPEYCISDELKELNGLPTYSFSDSAENKDFEGMTNGEVIQALFPNADYCGGAHFMHITNVNSIGEVSFPWEWWNAPYKAEREDKE